VGYGDLNIGNMSNPSINRVGKNIFWHRHWYSDKIFQLNIQQDFNLDKFIYYYLAYGLNHLKNIFISSYWYKVDENVKLNHQNLLKYYRTVEVEDRVFHEKNLVSLRINNFDLFYSKIWILRYQGWYFFNFYGFSYVKKKNSKKNFKFQTSTFLHFTEKKTFKFIKRFKFITKNAIIKYLQFPQQIYFF